MSTPQRSLFDLRFLVDHVFTDRRIVLLRLHLFRMQLFVFRSRVKVTGASTGNETDFFAICLSHCPVLLDALTLLAQVRNDFVDAVLVDDSHALHGDA